MTRPCPASRLSLGPWGVLAQPAGSLVGSACATPPGMGVFRRGSPALQVPQRGGPLPCALVCAGGLPVSVPLDPDRWSLTGSSLCPASALLHACPRAWARALHQPWSHLLREPWAV